MAGVRLISDMACPKVNLTLQVLGRRPDGYHEIVSLVAFARNGPYDEIVFWVGEEPGVILEGPYAAAISGLDLVSRTFADLSRVVPKLTLGSIILKKNLPIAAGIGGGSADVGALLRAVQQANPDRHLLDDPLWYDIARRAGADVPVCLFNYPTWIRGMGEHLDSVPDFPELPAVLVNPQCQAPPGKTRQVFAELNAPLFSPSTTSPERHVAGIHIHGRKSSSRFLTTLEPPQTFGSVAEVVAEMRRHGNKLTCPAVRLMPEIADVLAALAITPSCLRAQMSGAGPTCFGIYPSEELAKNAAAVLSARHVGWWVHAVTLS